MNGFFVELLCHPVGVGWGVTFGIPYNHVTPTGLVGLNHAGM
jgi:hypothetical protein